MKNSTKNILTIAGCVAGLIIVYEMVNKMQVANGNVGSTFNPFTGLFQPTNTPVVINGGNNSSAEKAAMWGAIGTVGGALVNGIFSGTGDKNGGN